MKTETLLRVKRDDFSSQLIGFIHLHSAEISLILISETQAIKFDNVYNCFFFEIEFLFVALSILKIIM